MVLTAGADYPRVREGEKTETAGSVCDCEQLRRLIDQRTGGRVHGLDVSVDPRSGLYTVTGTVGSHYVRQLALAAIIDSLGEEAIKAVRLDISVKKPTK